MRKTLAAILTVLCLCLPLFAAQKQDVVYLKNGSVIRGEITEQIPNVSVKIETKDGSIFVYKMGEVEKITRETEKETDGEKMPAAGGSPVDFGTGSFGLHAGVGTDISLGLAFGGGVSYILMSGENSGMEFGLDLYYSHSDTTSTEEWNGYDYRDVTTTIFFAVSYNNLFNYMPDKTGLYFLIGTGAGAASVSWEGSSTDDPSYNDSWDRIGGGFLVNLGLGWTFGNGFELRLQLPVMLIVGAFDSLLPVPMLNAAAGIRF